MQIIKIIFLLLIFSSSTIIGILLSRKYFNRVNELKEMKNALNMFETKIRFTYSPIPEIFNDIANNFNHNISNIFKNSSIEMLTKTAGQAWKETIDKSNTNMNTEDLNIIKDLGKLLGKTDVEGQISQIKLTSTFIDSQIEKAESERTKNEKMYKTLGMVTGLAIVIVLI